MKRVIEDSILHDIAKAIQEKNGTGKKYKDFEMAQAVREIQGGDEVLASLSDKSITEVTIPNGTTSIGKYVFYECKSLTSITIPESVTTIGYAAFQSCTGLISVNIPNSVTSIGERAFQSCTNLTDVVIPNGITTINGSTFHDCKNLSNFPLPTNLTEIYANAFYNVKKISNTWRISNKITRLGSLPNGFIGGKLIFEEGVTSFPMGTNVYNYGGCTFSNNAYVYLPSTISEVGNSFTLGNNMSGLKSPDGTCTLEVGEGFNVSINASQFIQTAKKWIKVFEALADRTGLETYTLTIGATNLAKLTEEDIAIATNKNWTVA